MDMVKQLAQELGLREEQVAAAVRLIDEGNTIPSRSWPPGRDRRCS